MIDSITAVPGIRVGHAQNADARTGCTVVLGPFRGACDIRGLASGTRELGALSPSHVVGRADGLLLTGGSAFGLRAADGAVQWLRERGAGYDTGVARVPIVPGAVIFDLAVGRADVWPDADMGRAACDAATGDRVAEGAVGAGTGATVGKLRGPEHACRGGVGSWAVEGPDCVVGALAVVNAFGDVLDEDGRVLAGARDDAGAFQGTARTLVEGGEAGVFQRPPRQEQSPGMNTTLAVVATDAPLTRAALQGLARAGATAVARRISPVHTIVDGDVTFALSTDTTHSTEADPARMLTLGALAAHALEHAIARAVSEGADA